MSNIKIQLESIKFSKKKYVIDKETCHIMIQNENLKRSTSEDVRNIYALYTEAKAKLTVYLKPNVERVIMAIQEMEFDNKTLANELQARDEELIIKNVQHITD